MAFQASGATVSRSATVQWLLARLRRQLTPLRLAFGLVLLAYIALTVAVIAGWTPVDALDQKIDLLRLRRRWPQVHRFFLDYVMLGQRGPSTFATLPIFAWLAWRRRSWQPLFRLAVALLVLNLSVGVVKVATGRWGPLVTRQAHDVFAGGNIFPSGHTANAVVLYGVLAMVVARRWRIPMIVAAVWISVTVGLSTLYLDTHWLTDVVGAWLAGALVLLALPRCELVANRLLISARDWVRARRTARRSGEADAGELLRTLPERTRDDLVV
jgi:membrane-associated phospholipid phosphatase